MVYLNLNKTKRNEDVKVIDGGTREEARARMPKSMHGAYDKKMSQVDRKNSYGTEDVLRRKFDSAVKKDPGIKSSIAGEFRKY